MSAVRRVFAVGYATIAMLFYGCALALVVSLRSSCGGVDPTGSAAIRARLFSVLEAIALLTIAVAAISRPSRHNDFRN